MPVLKTTRKLRDAPEGAPIMDVPAGTRVAVGAAQGEWIEITLVDDPNQPKGWVTAISVDLTADTLGSLDKQVFALRCHWHASIFGVSAHYIAAIATLRTDVTDGPGQGGAIGPFAFTPAEWALNATQPQFQLAAPAASINSWSLQIAVFAIMARLAQQRLAALLGSQPTATELYFSQLVGSKAAVLALQDRKAKVADIIAAIDPAAAGADGVDIANRATRDAELLGTGSVEAALKAISAALMVALEASKSFVAAAGDQVLAATGAALQPAGAVSGRINFESPRIPGGRRNMAELIALRFSEAGYGVLQQIAAIANAIGESGLDPTIKAAGNEESYGLFQLNRNGGVGTGHSVADLRDAEKNIAIMLAHIATLSANAAFKATASLHDAVAIFVRDFERPANPAGAIVTRSAIAQDLLI